MDYVAPKPSTSNRVATWGEIGTIPATKGTGVIDFGAFPGASDALLVITGQTGIVSGSFVHASLLIADSADHLADEHWVEPIEITVGKIVAGVGFSIYANYEGQANELSNSTSPSGGKPGWGQAPRIYGKWNVQWFWF